MPGVRVKAKVKRWRLTIICTKKMITKIAINCLGEPFPSGNNILCVSHHYSQSIYLENMPWRRT